MGNNKRINRGKDSSDDKLFGSVKELNKLKLALKDLHYLLTNGYAMKSSHQLVSHRYRLTSRQMVALMGMSCSERNIQKRKNKEFSIENLKGKKLYIDGFNVLILLESLFSGAFIFKGLDGYYRDISSVHGTYKMVKQTEMVLKLVGKFFQELEVEKVIWIFDKPVSNSGRIKTACLEIAENHKYDWEVLLELAPDKFLVTEDKLVCTSDAWILDHCSSSFNLMAFFIGNQKMEFSIIDLD